MTERSKEKGQTKKMHTLLKLIGRTGIWKIWNNWNSRNAANQNAANRNAANWSKLIGTQPPEKSPLL